MNKKDLQKIKENLTARQKELLKSAEATMEQGIGFSTDDLADEVDLASTESEQSMLLRLRDRERILFRKIDKALKKIENGEYGICERCGEEIGLKRILARPVTDLCIRCKEEEERVERTYAE